MNKIKNFPNANEKPKKEKFNEFKPYAKLEIMKLDNGREVSFLKVRHTKETLKQFSGEIESLVRSADIILSERAIFNNQERDEGDSFYEGITQMIEKNEKKMVVVEPEKDYPSALAGVAMSSIPSLASLGSGAYLASKFAELMHKREMENLQKEFGYADEKEQKVKINRREFLKYSIAGAVTISGGLHGIAGLLESLGIGEEKGIWLETFLLDSLDYRNAVIAKEMMLLTENDKKVAVIYGARHAKGVKKFLRSPELLEKKIELYQKTFGLINPINKEIYDFKNAN